MTFGRAKNRKKMCTRAMLRVLEGWIPVVPPLLGREFKRGEDKDSIRPSGKDLLKRTLQTEPEMKKVI